MNLKSVKKNYGWEPIAGDYSKSYADNERKALIKKQNRYFLYTSLYIVVLIGGVILLYMSFK